MEYYSSLSLSLSLSISTRDRNEKKLKPSGQAANPPHDFDGPFAAAKIEMGHLLSLMLQEGGILSYVIASAYHQNLPIYPRILTPQPFLNHRPRHRTYRRARPRYWKQYRLIVCCWKP